MFDKMTQHVHLSQGACKLQLFSFTDNAPTNQDRCPHVPCRLGTEPWDDVWYDKRFAWAIGCPAQTNSRGKRKRERADTYGKKRCGMASVSSLLANGMMEVCIYELSDEA